MKKPIIILLMIALYSLSAPAQPGPDTSATTRPKQERTGQKFVDENGDGINDRLAGQGKGPRRGKDRFIDRDGDGICDDRAAGLGFRRGAGGAGGYMGGDSKGRGKRQGAKP